MAPYPCRMANGDRQHRAMVLALINSPSHWRDRAEEARRIAEDMADAEAKRMMLDIADGYDRLAHHAENRLLASHLGGHTRHSEAPPDPPKIVAAPDRADRPASLGRGGARRSRRSKQSRLPINSPTADILRNFDLRNCLGWAPIAGGHSTATS